MVLTKRKIIKFGGSRAVILPSDWFKTFKLKEKQQLLVAYGNAVLILPIDCDIDDTSLLNDIICLFNQIKGGKITT